IDSAADAVLAADRERTDAAARRTSPSTRSVNAPDADRASDDRRASAAVAQVRHAVLWQYSCMSFVRLRLRARYRLEQAPKGDEIVERDHAGHERPIERPEYGRRHHGGPDHLSAQAMNGGRTRIGSWRDVAVLVLGTDAPRQHREQDQPPDDEIDRCDR